MSRRIVRGALEMPDGSYRAPKAFTEQHTVEALTIVRRDVKRALWGLAALLGEDLLVDMCRDVIREDSDPDGPQTPMGLDGDG